MHPTEGEALNWGSVRAGPSARRVRESPGHSSDVG